jgi:hypothetical protein
MSLGKTLILIHGSGNKPARSDLEDLWLEALGHAIALHHPDRLGVFQSTKTEFVFYGDVIGNIRTDSEKQPDPRLDLADRRAALKELKMLKRKHFITRSRYERLPGQSSLPELLADVGLPVARALGASDAIISRVMPELSAYWRDQVVSDALRQRMDVAFARSFGRGDEVAVVAHGMGSVVAYDCLWRLTNDNTPAWYGSEKVELLLTLGSPLGDETVKRRLLGGRTKGAARYPGNIVRWMNLVAEDDYIAHDNTVANDFSGMLRHHMVSRIEDQTLLNFTVRYGRSNPHSALGYLVHPRTARIVSDWLGPASTETP